MKKVFSSCGSSIILYGFVLLLIGCAAFIFPETARHHPVAFILAAALCMVLAVCQSLLDSYRKEQEIIHQMQQERELYQLNAQMDMALRGVNGGFAIMKDDDRKSFVHVSESLAALMGYTVEEFLQISTDGAASMVVETDCFDNLDDKLEATKTEEGREDEQAVYLRFHSPCKTGQLKWLSCYIRPVYNEQGKREWYAFCHDITPLEKSRKQLVETAIVLQQERQMYRDALLYDCDYAYIVNINENKVHDIYKEGFLKKFGFDRDKPYDETMQALVQNMNPVIMFGVEEIHLCQHYIDAYERGERVLEVTYYIFQYETYKKKTIFLSKTDDDIMFAFVVAHDITEKFKEELETEKALTLLANSAKKIGAGDLDAEIDVSAPGLVGVLATVLNETITNLKWHIDNLSQEANKDPLTGVKNKRAWQNTEETVNKAICNGEAYFAVVVCDVNGLKQVNDTIGHDVGDLLILRASRIICDAFVHSPVYRIGGDEFTVLLTGPDLAAHKRLLGTFPSLMDKANQENPDEPPLSIAVGIAHYDMELDTSFADVFKRADIAMYQNKTAMKKAMA